MTTPYRPPRAPTPPRGIDPFDGVLLVDKPSGPTSHDIVDTVRRHFGLRKVGHGGTLDPQATGLLAVLVGRATKLSAVFMNADKTYEGVLRLGIETDSQDGDGVVIRESDYVGVTAERVAAAMATYVGDLMQTPPMVSAVKVDGVPLYRRARRGQTIERAARLIHVYEFGLQAFDPPDAAFRIRCTKGTYVRTLCADIGKDLGCGAHLARLRRTASGDHRVEDARPLDAVLQLDRTGLSRAIIPLRRLARPGAAP